MTSEPTQLINLISDKNILCITTKNTDYIRNTQEIRLLKTYSKNLSTVGSNSKHYTIRLAKVYLNLLFTKTNQYDLIFVGFAPQLILPLFLYKFKSKPIIIDFFISFYDTLCFDRRKFRPNSFMGRLIKKLDIFTLNNCNHIIADTNTDADFFASEFAIDRNKFITYYLEADKDIYFPTASENKRTDIFNVLYFGTNLPLQGTDIILEAMSSLSAHEDIHFYFIGHASIEQLSIIKNIANLTYMIWLHQPDLAKYISQADLCLGGHFNANIGKASRTIPGKAFIYEAMKKPMILGDNPANRELFSEDNPLVTYVPMSDSEALANSILTVKNKIQKR